MSIISISGRIGAGKDSAARTIQWIISDLKDKNTTSLEHVIDDPDNNDWWLEDSSEWHVVKFAGALKQIASILTGISQRKFEDQEFKKTELGPEWDKVIPLYTPGIFEPKLFREPMTVRELLQKIGTEAIRNGLHKNAWVNAMFADYERGPHSGVTRDMKYPNWIITDTRFSNEFESVKQRDGLTLFIERGDGNTGTHPSEVEMMSFRDKCDYIIDNNGTLEDLKDKLQVILKEQKII